MDSLTWRARTMLPTMSRGLAVPSHAYMHEEQHLSQQPQPLINDFGVSDDTMLLECTDELVDDSVIISDNFEKAAHTPQHPKSSSGSEIAWNAMSNKTASLNPSALHSSAGSSTNLMVNSPSINTTPNDPNTTLTGATNSLILMHNGSGNETGDDSSEPWDDDNGEQQPTSRAGNSRRYHNNTTRSARPGVSSATTGIGVESAPDMGSRTSALPALLSSRSQSNNVTLNDILALSSSPLSPNSTALVLAAAGGNRTGGQSTVSAEPVIRDASNNHSQPQPELDLASMMKNVVWITSTTAAVPGTGVLFTISGEDGTRLDWSRGPPAEPLGSCIMCGAGNAYIADAEAKLYCSLVCMKKGIVKTDMDRHLISVNIDVSKLSMPPSSGNSGPQFKWEYFLHTRHDMLLPSIECFRPELRPALLRNINTPTNFSARGSQSDELRRSLYGLYTTKRENTFRPGMLLKSYVPYDKRHLYLCRVIESKGFRLRLRMCYFPSNYDFWVHYESPFIFPCTFCGCGPTDESKTSCPPAVAAQHGAPIEAFTSATRTLVEQTSRAVAMSPKTHINAANRLKLGQFVELVDSASRMPCTNVGRIKRVLPSKVLVHYVGKPDSFEEWLDCDSPRIRYVGFSAAELNRPTLPPHGWDEARYGKFDWSKLIADMFNNQNEPLYAEKNNMLPNNFNYIDKNIDTLTRDDYLAMRAQRHLTVRRNFRIGNVVEAVDPMCPRAVRACCIVGTSEYRVQLHMLGMPPELDFWLDDASDQIFPPGYVFAHGYTLTPPQPWTTPFDLSSSPFTTCQLIGCLGWGHAFGGCREAHLHLNECPYAAFLCGFGLPALAGSENDITTRTLKSDEMDGAKPLVDFNMCFVEQRLPALLLAEINSPERKAKVEAMQQAIDAKLRPARVAVIPPPVSSGNVTRAGKSSSLSAASNSKTANNNMMMPVSAIVPKDTNGVSAKLEQMDMNDVRYAASSSSSKLQPKVKSTVLGRPPRRMKSKYMKHVRNKRLLESLESRFDACGCLGFPAIPDDAAAAVSSRSHKRRAVDPLSKCSSPAAPLSNSEGGTWPGSPASPAENGAVMMLNGRARRPSLAPPPPPRTLLDLARLDLHLYAVHSQLSNVMRRKLLSIRVMQAYEQTLQHQKRQQLRSALTLSSANVIPNNNFATSPDADSSQSSSAHTQEVPAGILINDTATSDPLQTGVVAARATADTPVSSPPPTTTDVNAAIADPPRKPWKKPPPPPDNSSLSQMLSAPSLLNIEQALLSGHAAQRASQFQRVPQQIALMLARNSIENFLRNQSDESATISPVKSSGVNSNMMGGSQLSTVSAAESNNLLPQPSTATNRKLDASCDNNNHNLSDLSAAARNVINTAEIISGPSSGAQTASDTQMQQQILSSEERRLPPLSASPSAVKEVQEFFRSHFIQQQRQIAATSSKTPIDGSSSVS